MVGKVTSDGDVLCAPNLPSRMDTDPESRFRRSPVWVWVGGKGLRHCHRGRNGVAGSVVGSRERSRSLGSEKPIPLAWEGVTSYPVK